MIERFVENIEKAIASSSIVLSSTVPSIKDILNEISAIIIGSEV